MICNYPINIQRPNSKSTKDRINVPCGKCSICQTRRRNDWSIRLQEELKEHDRAIFLTLTYSPEHLHWDSCGAHLYKRDLQLFFKRLRKALSTKVRYYAIGEYGTNTNRPHYHAIVFGISSRSHSTIERAWNKGLIHIGDVTPASIQYTTKFHVNKKAAPLGLAPEFAVMSTKPAIGHSYIKRMQNHHDGKIENNYYQDFQTKRHLPRYYRDKLYSEAERQEIASKFTSENYNQTELEAYRKKYPNGNFFQYIEHRKKAQEANFKNKSINNDKI